MNTRLLTSFCGSNFNALLLGTLFMFFYGDIVHYFIPMDKNVGYYSVAGAVVMALVFLQGILINLCFIYHRKGDTKEKV